MPGCNKRYSRAGRLKIHMRLHVSYFIYILIINSRQEKDRLYVQKMDVKKLLEKKEIY
jgi:hypothetical protein